MAGTAEAKRLDEHRGSNCRDLGWILGHGGTPICQNDAFLYAAEGGSMSIAFQKKSALPRSAARARSSARWVVSGSSSTAI